MSIAVAPKSTAVTRPNVTTAVTVAGSRAVVRQEVMTAVTQAAPRMAVSHRGPRGPAGEPVAIEVTAGETISALRPIVVIDGIAWHADHTNPDHAGRVVGISFTSATAGNPVTVKTDGCRITDDAWSWSADAVFVGEGVLTQSPPSSGFLQSIGVVMSPTEIMVLVGDALER